MSDDQADPRIVEKFTDDGSVPANALPVASLAVLWYVDADGVDGVMSKMDGQQRVSVTVGDLVGLIHFYLHSNDDD